MGTSTLTLSNGTWIEPSNQTPHSTETLLRTAWYTTTYTAVVQFTIPQSLRYKRFTNATLSFYTTAVNNLYGTGVRLSVYKTGDTLDSLIWSNVGVLGERGEIIDAEPFDIDPSKTFPRWRNLDITGIFAGNIVDGTYFTVMINAFPGNSYDYAGIGNYNLSGYETKLILTYEDVSQLPPSPSYPVGTYVSEDTDLLFAWNWEATTGATQAAVQLEYKLKTAQSWTVVSLTQTNHTYLLTGGLSTQGVYQWRIKGTNDAGEVSDYSSIAEFNVVGQPAAPVIDNVPNKTLTTITWTTSDQNAFDIQIIDSNNNTILDDSVASSVASYKPNIFLKGSYTAKVRVRNSTGLVSTWGTKAFTINASGPSASSIQLLQNDTHISISTTTASSTNYAVIRIENEDGPEEILGTMTAGQFTDSTFGFDRQYKYIVRAWATGGYTDSAPERICYPYPGIVLETTDDELVLDKSEDTYLPYAEDVSRETAIYNCIGRALPVVEHGAFESRAFRSRLYVHEDQKERLVAMARKDRIYYRDYSGRAFPVAINPPINFERWMGDGYMADIQFVRISDTEVVINV